MATKKPSYIRRPLSGHQPAKDTLVACSLKDLDRLPSCFPSSHMASLAHNNAELGSKGLSDPCLLCSMGPRTQNVTLHSGCSLSSWAPAPGLRFDECIEDLASEPFQSSHFGLPSPPSPSRWRQEPSGLHFLSNFSRFFKCFGMFFRRLSASSYLVNGQRDCSETLHF